MRLAKASKSSCLTIIIYLLFTIGCSTITSQMYPIAGDNILRNAIPDKKLKLRINYYSGSLGNKTRSHDISTNLAPEIKKIFNDSQWFSEVHIVEEPMPKNFFRSQFSERLKSLDEDFKVTGKSEEDYDLELSIYVQSNGIVSSKLKNIFAILTFSLIPVNEEHSYKVGFQLKSKKLNANFELMFDELYNIRTTIIPLPGVRVSDHSTEPVLNVVKLAMLDYQKNGLLK